MLNVRVSTINRFRDVICPTPIAVEHGFAATEEEVVAAIRAGQDTPSDNWKMDVGTVWHDILDSDEPLPASPQCDPLDFQAMSEYQGGPAVFSGDWSFDAVAVARARNRRGAGLREVTGRKVFETAQGPIQVKGTTDHIHGLRLRDAKTCFSGVNPQQYEPSLQWRFYLSIFGADQFTYDLFDFRDPDDNGHCFLKDIVSFSFWRYPALGHDLQVWVQHFTAWAERKGLLGDLEQAAFATKGAA